MSRLRPVHWQRLECVFLKAGFKFERESGSHRLYSKKGVPRPIVIPKYDEVGRDIINSNCRSAGISRDKYFELLDQC